MSFEQSDTSLLCNAMFMCSFIITFQIWRTYLKHCSNMGSVRPMSYTYEAIRNMVRQIHLGPEKQAIEMIAKRSQESFKHMLNIRKAAKVAGEKVVEASGSYGATNGGDADGEDLSLDLELQSYMSFPQQSGDDQVDWKETSDTVKSYNQKQRSDELTANSATISDDILFQLAKECQGAAAATSPIQPQGISIFLEKGTLALLSYSPRDSGSMQVHEPFKVITEDNDFVAFRVCDEDNGVEEVYENWSKDKLCLKLTSEPDKFFKCVLTVKSRDLAVAMVLGLVSSNQMISKQIEIHGLLSRGHAFDGDTVVVEVMGYCEDILQGQVSLYMHRTHFS